MLKWYIIGEPIMYPEISKFVTLLHEKGISSFLVTNAQFPEAIRLKIKNLLILFLQRYSFNLN